MHNVIATDPLVGSLFDRRYLIDRLIAQGGMGNIYQAHDTKNGQIIALKLLRNEFGGDRIIVQRFLREVQALAQLKHPNICQLFDSGYTSEGIHYFSMEYLQGQSLDAIIASHQRLEPLVALNYIAQAASALCDAHLNGIVHRDLKPANIFIVQTPSTPDFVKVLDFGVAKIAANEQKFEPKLTNVGSTLGTPYYMSPEQIQGTEIDGRSDVYALGVILWECLFGAPPFGGKTIIEVFSATVKHKLPKLNKSYRKIPPYKELYAILQKALEKDAKKRYHSMLDFLRALEAAQRTLGLTGPLSGLNQAVSNRTPLSLPVFRAKALSLLRKEAPLKLSLMIVGLTLTIATIFGLAVYFTPAFVNHEITQYHTYKFFTDLPAEIYVNGRIVATSPSSADLADQAPFDIVFVASSNANNRYTFHVSTLSNDIMGYAVRLSNAPHDQADIGIETTPMGSDVYVNGTKHPLQTPCNVAVTSEQNILITIRQKGYKTEHILTAPNRGPLKLKTNLFRQ